MASIGVDLGQLGLASTASGLQLQLNSHAEIASPEEGSDFDPCALITTERPWCRRGHGFRLSVSLSFDGEETGQSIEALGNAVAQQLGLAEQWHQFPLCPASIKHTITGTEEASIVVHLDYHNTKPPKRQLHKLEDGVPDHDRAPPIGANTVTLNLIHLAMRFSRTHSRKRRKLQPSLSEVSTNKVHSKAHREGNGGACRRSKTSPVPECAIGGHADTPCEASRSSAQMLMEDATTARTSRKRSYSTGDLKVGGQISSIHDDLLELFDAGLRLAVTPHPSRLPKGIRIVANESFKHLAYSFPALWSPGHLAAVSGRAVFLPTVSHALANVCSLHAQNSVLRSKFAELSRQVTSSDRGSGISDRSPANEHGFSSTAQQSIATRVWETVQRTLFNKGGTCAKKPFSHCFEQELDEQGEDIWAEPMGLDNYSAEYQDIDDFLSDSEESMLDEEPLTPEPRAGHGTSLLWNECGASENHVPDYPTGHVAGQKRGSHVEQEHEDDELLSLCDSVGSLAIDAFMDVASSPGPEAWLMAAEEVVEKNLFDAEMEMDEFIPI